MKINIIGAGPAGVSAAYRAIKEGHDVTIYEKEKVLAKKPCGEASFSEIEHLTPFSKFDKQDFILAKFRKALVYINHNFVSELKMPFQCYVFNKSRFLEEYLEYAEALGVKVKRGTLVTENSDVWKEEMVIDATGYIRMSRFAKQQCPKVIPVLRAYTDNNKIINDDEILIDIIGPGYFWIFPYDNLYNVGYGGHINSGDVKTILNECIKHYNLTVKSRTDGAGIVVSGPPKRLIYGNIRLAGESMGAVNAGTGEGIRFSLYAGMMAIDNDYEKKFWKMHGENLKRCVKFGGIFLSLKPEQFKKIFDDASPELMMTLVDGKKLNLKTGLQLLFKDPSLFFKYIKS